MHSDPAKAFLFTHERKMNEPSSFKAIHVLSYGYIGYCDCNICFVQSHHRAILQCDKAGFCYLNVKTSRTFDSYILVIVIHSGFIVIYGSIFDNLAHLLLTIECVGCRSD